MFVTPGSRAARKRSGGGGGTPGGTTLQVQYNNAGVFGGMSGSSWDDTNRALTLNGATVTASNPILNLSQTWNNAAVGFTALNLSITPTAANVSNLLNINFGGSNMFTIYSWGTNTKVGLQIAYSVANPSQVFQMQWGLGAPFTMSTNNAASGIGLSAGGTNTIYFDATNARMGSAIPFGWSSSTDSQGGALDVILVRDAANILAQRNGVTGQLVRIYNTTDAPTTNFERAVAGWATANGCYFASEFGGTGTQRGAFFGSYAGLASGTTGFNGMRAIGGQTTLYVNGTAFIDSGTGPSYTQVLANLFVGGAGGGGDIGLWRTTKNVLQLNNGTINVLTGAYFQWGGQARTTADFSKTDAALADITGLSSTISVGSSAAGTRAYSFNGWFPCTMGSSAGGIQFAVTCTSTTVTSIIYSGYALNNGTVQGSSIQATAIGTAVAVSTGPATALSAYISGLIRVASSGLLKFQFAQVSSNATASVVSSGAYVMVYDMP